MELDDVFGVNLENRYHRWIREEYIPRIRELYPGMNLTLVILENENMLELHDDWAEPLTHTLIVAHTGDEGEAEKSGGTLQNVGGKLQFVLRTCSDSVEAEDDLAYLVEPGDFPFEGAGSHRGYFGGVSGLAKEDDWTEFEFCVDHLIEMRREICVAAVARAKELREDESVPEEIKVKAKYLRGIDVSDQFPEPEDESEAQEADEADEAASAS